MKQIDRPALPRPRRAKHLGCRRLDRIAALSENIEGAHGGRDAHRRALGASEVAVAHAQLWARGSLRNFRECALVTPML